MSHMGADAMERAVPGFCILPLGGTERGVGWGVIATALQRGTATRTHRGTAHALLYLDIARVLSGTRHVT